jgi:hypothetical protein
MVLERIKAKAGRASPEQVIYIYIYRVCADGQYVPRPGEKERGGGGEEGKQGGGEGERGRERGREREPNHR